MSWLTRVAVNRIVLLVVGAVTGLLLDAGLLDAELAQQLADLLRQSGS